MYSSLCISPRNHHGAHDDDPQHQRTSLSAQGLVRHGHGLVHRGVFCFRLLCSHRVCRRELLHQRTGGESQEKTGRRCRQCQELRSVRQSQRHRGGSTGEITNTTAIYIIKHTVMALTFDGMSRV